MAADRFIRWQTGRRPTREDLQHMLEDFLGSAEAGTLVWDIDRFFITLPGRKSQAFRRVATVTDVARNYAEELLKADADSRYHDITRSIEVWIADDCIDVMTRSADDFTNGVAARLAECCARFWDGKVEAG